jgi:hypothetical protein
LAVRSTEFKKVFILFTEYEAVGFDLTAGELDEQIGVAVVVIEHRA